MGCGGAGSRAGAALVEQHHQLVERPPHALIPVGYAAADPVRRERRPLDELVVLFD
jgi:hypothetical protein